MLNARLILTANVIGAIALTAALTGCSHNAPHNVMASDQADRLVPHPNVVLASQGRIEGRTETVQIGAGADGIVKQVFVKEGQEVWRGTKLADIDCSDLDASLMSAKAEADSARQVKARLVHGSRDEERLAAEQRTAAAKAVLEESASRLKRTQELKAGGVISENDF